MYWEITPHADDDSDIAIMPARTESEDQDALEYAQDRLEVLWDAIGPGQTITVTMKLCEGEMPEEE